MSLKLKQHAACRLTCSTNMEIPFGYMSGRFYLRLFCHRIKNQSPYLNDTLTSRDMGFWVSQSQEAGCGTPPPSMRTSRVIPPCNTGVSAIPAQCHMKVDQNLSTSDFQSEAGEVFGEVGGELPAKFGRRFSSFFCWGKSSEDFPPKLHRKFHH